MGEGVGAEVWGGGVGAGVGDADGGADEGVAGHFDVAVGVADEGGGGGVDGVIAAGDLDHFRGGFAAGAGAGEVGAGVDGVEGGGMLAEGGLHGVVDGVEVGEGHEAFGDALLIGDEDAFPAHVGGPAHEVEESVGEVEVGWVEDVAVAGAGIDDSVAVEEEGRGEGWHGLGQQQWVWPDCSRPEWQSGQMPKNSSSW